MNLPLPFGRPVLDVSQPIPLGKTSAPAAGFP